MPHALRLALLLIWLPVAVASAPTRADQLGPGDEYEREIGAKLPNEITLGQPLIEEAVRRRMQRDGLAEPVARLIVQRKLAAVALEGNRYQLAEAHYNSALELATALQDANLIIDLTLGRARVRYEAGDRSGALDDARIVWDTAKRIGRAPAQLDAGFLIAEIWRVSGRPREGEVYLDEMLTLPGADRLKLELQRAQITDDTKLELVEARWREVARLAAERRELAIQARALDQLGRYAMRRSDWNAAVTAFRDSEALGSSRRRPADLWYIYSEALTKLQRPAEARAAIERGLAEVDPQTAPRIAADLEDARAALLAQVGDPAGAYAALRRAQKLREQAAVSAVRVGATRMVPQTPAANTQQAAALAAARHALRDAELESERVRSRATISVAIISVFLATALGLAYFYKRRAARALATAKDAAELRAERTHWQMLRYQLNPHFLHNSLASLSGLIVLDPESARRTAGRLSDFCRLALQKASGDLRKVEDEMQMLAAFTDVEQAGAGDSLRVRFEVDPAARHLAVPPLLLQPLVENALKYGEPAADGVREVVISARCDRDRLVLEVANTGAWIERSKPANRPPRTGTGLGLSNVRERLGRLGATASLETLTEPGWVRIRATLPRWEPDRVPAEIAAAIRSI